MFFISSSLVNEIFTWYRNLGWQFLFVLFLCFTHWKYHSTVFWLLLVLRNKSGKYALCFWRLPSPAALKRFSLFLVFCSFMMMYLGVDFFLFTRMRLQRILDSVDWCFHQFWKKNLSYYFFKYYFCPFSFCSSSGTSVKRMLDLFIVYCISYPLFCVFCPFISTSFWKLLAYLAVHLFSMYNLLLKLFSVFLILFISSGIFTVF